jgi:hypothetical protein
LMSAAGHGIGLNQKSKIRLLVNKIINQKTIG